MNYDNNNRGVLFKADKKSEKAPDYTGTITITPDMAGKELRLAAWIKKSAKGTTFMSLAVTEQQTQSEPRTQKQNTDYGFDDDQHLPF